MQLLALVRQRSFGSIVCASRGNDTARNWPLAHSRLVVIRYELRYEEILGRSGASKHRKGY